MAVVHRLEPDGDLIEITSIPIDVTKNRSVLSDELDTEWGLFSNYIIVNSDEFYESVSEVQYDEVGDEEEDEDDGNDETEVLKVIKDWREEKEHPLAQRFLGGALVRLAALRLSKNDTSEVLELIEESLGLLRECDIHNSGIRLSIARALTVKADVLLREQRSFDEVKVLLEEARELVYSLKPDRSTEEVSERIDRLFKKTRI